MGYLLPESEQENLTEFADKLQHARASDLEDHTNSLTEDTYRIKHNIYNAIYYWPDGHDGSVEDIPYLKQLSPTEERCINEFENNSKYTFLDYGVGRIAFTIDDNPQYIVKVGRWGLETIMGNGVQVNQSEKRFYNHVDPILEDNPLLPIAQIDDQNNWILQRKVTTYEEYEGDDKPDFETILEDINDRLGPFSGLITDKAENNIGYVDEEWYLFDYGQRL